MLMHYLCPQCQLPITQQNKAWRCDNNHSFDIARQGYCNLLLVQNKRSKIPGDDAGMVAARKRFLELQHYLPLSEALNKLVAQQLKNIDTPFIIDAGCGEGYYTDQLEQTLKKENNTASITGIDISKFAVKAAAKRNPFIQWFVANSSHLPVEDNICDVLISLFSPIPEQEFSRCLNEQGLLIIASTGKNHLIELRKILYETVDESTLNPASKLTDTFSLSHHETIRFTIELESTETISDLLSMTPHYWKSSPERKKILETYQQLSVSVDIDLHCFTKIPSQ
jgi:23S rRNA (guanine745-N1)-methyltransferase